MQNLLRCSVAVCMVSWAGCAEKSPSNPAEKGTTAAAANTNNEPPRPGWPPTKAHPKLRTTKLDVGAEVITAELALTPAQVGTGMMFRTSMREDEGMLFVFPRPHRTAFYMKNTTLPLTAAYID